MVSGHQLLTLGEVALCGVLATGCSYGESQTPATGTATPTSDASGGSGPQIQRAYADLADVRVYYESAGSGPPIVFLHGGFGSSETWRSYFPSLAQDFTVIAPDSRGQGRSTLGTGPISYGRMAADAVRLLDHLRLEKAHFVGFSDGGCTTLHLLTDYSDRVRSATLIGTPFHTDNYPPAVFASLKEMISGLGGSEQRRAAYAATAANPEEWPELTRRLGRTWLTQPTFSEEELTLVETPVLVVKVDRDQFLPPQIFDRLAALIPGARLLHVPEGTHSVPMEKPVELANGIRTFIASLSNQ